MPTFSILSSLFPPAFQRGSQGSRADADGKRLPTPCKREKSACLPPLADALPSDCFSSDAFRASSTLTPASPEPLAIIDNFQHSAGRLEPLLIRKKGLTCTGLNAFAPHGALVAGHARSEYPTLPIEEFQVDNILEGGWCKPRPALERLLAAMEEGRRFAAVNYSFGLGVAFEAIREALNLPDLNRRNVAAYRLPILENFMQIPIDALLESLPPSVRHEMTAAEIKSEMRETLYRLATVAQQAPLFVSAGNDGPDSLNLNLLAPGAQGVGHKEPDNQATPSSGNNTLVRHWMTGQHKPVPVLDESLRLAGFHLQAAHLPSPRVAFNHQVNVHIPINRLYCLPISPLTDWTDPEFQQVPLRGTSFASPRAAAQSMRQKAQDSSFSNSFLSFVNKSPPND